MINYRGVIIYVKYIILMKSNFFKNILSSELFKKEEPSDYGFYYVYCDLNTKKIYTKYLMVIVNKYGIDI